MSLLRTFTGLSIAALVSLAALPALADQADKDACVNLQEGDDCTRGDGGPGVCIPDESDPNVLTCDDDPEDGSGGSGGSGASSGGCSTTGSPATPLPFALASLAALALLRRRPRTRA